MENKYESKILTIAIPAYNIETYIDRAVSGLLACNHLPSIDVIVINDGSTDSTLQRALVYAEHYPGSVRVIDKPNGHYGSAVNAAIEEAKGAYFKILDGDDEYYPDGLDELVSFLSSSDQPDMVLTDYEIEYEKTGKAVCYRQELVPRKTVPFESADLHPCAMHAMAIKTALLRAMDERLDEGVSFTDVEFVLYPVRDLSTVAYCDTLVYSYKIGREGQSVDISCIDRNMPSHELVLRHCIDWYERNSEKMTSARKEYAAERISRMLDDHVHRCLLSEESKRWLPGLKEIVERCERCQPLISYSTSMGLSILRATKFSTYEALNFIKRFTAK